MIEGIKVGDRVRSIKYPKESGEVREVRPGAVFVRLGDYPEEDPCWIELEHLEVIGVEEEVPESFRSALHIIKELKKERDLLKLRVVWREREVIFEIRRSLSHVSETHLARYRAAVKDMEEAKAAYLAAGGKE